MKYIEALGKTYYIDIDKINEFISYSDSSTSKEKEITDTYSYDENGLAQEGKIVREITEQANAQIDSIRYDLIKFLLNGIFEYKINDYEETTYGFAFSLNTLLKYEIIKEIETK